MGIYRREGNYRQAGIPVLAPDADWPPLASICPRMTASLYIHIPFCSNLCDYCDFFSVPVSEDHHADLLDSFVTAVLGDVKEQLAIFNIDDVCTVYIGGGTPSALGSARMERLLDGLLALLKPMSKAPAEFTVEANPESADGDFLKVCVSKGVNRLSLGVQTFHEPSRRSVTRHGSDKLEERLALAAEYFPGAFSVDLITGLPFQSAAIVQNDIRRVLTFRPAHVSLYSLSLEPQTPLGKKVSQLGEAALSLPCGDEADNLWIAGRDELEENGFPQYEVSNFAPPEKTCAHNIRYWHMENWIGAGPAASGTIIDDKTGTGKRFTYSADINAYLAAPYINSARIEDLDKTSLIHESLLMGFRYRKGPDPVLFRKRFGCSIEDCIPKTITRWRARNFFEAENSLAPSREGLLFLNGFLRDCFEEIEVFHAMNCRESFRKKYSIEGENYGSYDQ
jgi:oxygen-independent coproporphyrinogen-3 oxidase